VSHINIVDRHIAPGEFGLTEKTGGRRKRHVPARHLNASSGSKTMRGIVVISPLLIFSSLFVACSRKPEQTGPRGVKLS
jgi:hypothetical protein